MSFYTSQDILGFHFADDRVVCILCAERTDQPKSENDLIKKENVENYDHYYFCDKCGKAIILPSPGGKGALDID